MLLKLYVTKRRRKRYFFFIIQSKFLSLYLPKYRSSKRHKIWITDQYYWKLSARLCLWLWETGETKRKHEQSRLSSIWYLRSNSVLSCFLTFTIKPLFIHEVLLTIEELFPRAIHCMTAAQSPGVYSTQCRLKDNACVYNCFLVTAARLTITKQLFNINASLPLRCLVWTNSMENISDKRIKKSKRNIIVIAIGILQGRVFRRGNDLLLR